MTWTWTGDQKITTIWSAGQTQSGANVTAVNAGYNGNLAAGATTSFGFNGTYTGTNTPPTTLTCTPA